MNIITTRIQRNGHGKGLPMLTAGMATAFLFVFAVTVVGFDAATKGQGFSSQDGIPMQTKAVATTSAG